LNWAGCEDAVERVEPGKRKASRGASWLAEQVVQGHCVPDGGRVAVWNSIQNHRQLGQHDRLGEKHAARRKPEPSRFRGAIPVR
jgi:hypothetical protein